MTPTQGFKTHARLEVGLRFGHASPQTQYHMAGQYMLNPPDMRAADRHLFRNTASIGAWRSSEHRLATMGLS